MGEVAFSQDIKMVPAQMGKAHMSHSRIQFVFPIVGLGGGDGVGL